MVHEDFLRAAIQEAKNAAELGNYPFGAVIVKDDQIVGRSNVEISAYDPTAHAEVNAIRNACARLKTPDLSGCILYSSCHPCSLCLGAAKWAGIREMYYAMDQEDAARIGYKDAIFLDESVEISKHKLPDEKLVDFMKKWYGTK